MTRTGFISSCAVLLALAGCGGGSGGGGIFVQLPQAHMVQFQPGNDLKYSFAGALIEPSGGGVIAKGASGTYDFNCTARNGDLVTMVGTLKVTVSGGSFTSVVQYVYNQPADGSMTEVSEAVDGKPADTLTTSFKIPGTWSLTTTVSGNGTFSSGEAVSQSLFVLKAENVKVPAATYFAWEARNVRSDKSGVLADLVQDWEPGYSWWVKSSGLQLVAFGVISGDFTLASTNMKLPS